MVSILGSEHLLSLESRGGNLTADEELAYYRQRLQSMKLVLKELQQQLVLYKTRCAGVDTVALMLRECKQEVMKLTKQKKALETAVANLQNRLSTNGLSSSVTIEETEPFVPGASKQTLDNLARENARLRSLLKSHEIQGGKKSEEDFQNLRISIENLEAENNQLRTQKLEAEHKTQALTSQFEELVRKLKEEHQAEKLKLEQELNQSPPGKVSRSWQHEHAGDVQEKSKATQTIDVEPSKIDEVRLALKILNEKCQELDTSLENAQVAVECENKLNSLADDKVTNISEDAYMELEKRINQVMQMNQRWQVYNHSQEQQIHGFLARIAELEHLCQEAEILRNVANARESENVALRKEIDNLTRETNKLWSHPQFDVSIVEILKQQIQVCTEDFNTERKDREHAVNRAKQLQEEVNKLVNENDILRKDMDNLRRNTRPLENDKHDTQQWLRQQHFTPRGALHPPQRLPFLLLSSSGSPASAASSLSPVPSPVQSFMSTSSTGDRSSFYPPNSQDSMIGFQGPARVGTNRQHSNHGDDCASFPRANRSTQEAMLFANTQQRAAATNGSVPTLSKKSEGPARVTNRETDLTCPKCSKEFTEDQHLELVRHINVCKDEID